MSVEDWDHETYRTPFEPQEHWRLKEEFILAHKNEIKEDELVCLASVYVNMQLLGCRYPPPVAKRIQALSTGLGHSYKQWREGKLVRTFVKASDAAVAKIRRSDAPTTLGLQNETAQSSQLQNEGEVKKKKRGKESDEPVEVEPCLEKKVAHLEDECHNAQNSSLKRKGLEDIVENEDGTKKKKKLTLKPKPSNDSSDIEVLKKSKAIKNCLLNSTIDIESESESDARPAFNANEALDKLSDKIRKKKLQTNDGSMQKSKTTEFSVASLGDENGVFYGLIFLKQNNDSQRPSVVLNNFFPNSSYRIDETVDGCTAAYVRNVQVARLPRSVRQGLSKKETQQRLALEALRLLIKSCPLLALKFDCRETNVAEDGSLLGIEGYTADKIERISNDNIGRKMLQLMGWSGGGLGKNEAGRVDPVEVDKLDRRVGLGYTDINSEFKKKVDALLRNFKRDFKNGTTELEELVFPSVFSKEQRAYIHQNVIKYQLQSISYGKKNNRYMVVKPKMAHFMRAMQVLEKGGETNMYKVYPPGTYDLGIFNLDLT